MKTDAMCYGCEDDFYNGKNSMGVERCWHFKNAEQVIRYRIGTWTLPTQPGAFTRVRVLNCRHEKGWHFYPTLPDFVKTTDVRDKIRDERERAPCSR